VKKTMLMKLYYLLQTRLTKEEGQDLVEYALIIALIAVALVGGLGNLATAIAAAFTSISGNL
jgi:pilus assembly protein Flp/PilA